MNILLRQPSSLTGVARGALTLLCLAFFAVRLAGQDYVPERGKFPPPQSGVYIAGELAFIDPVNRRGGIRLDGDDDGRYHAGPLHYFALLPYGTVWYHGALAELRDLPLGTHVHGYFFVPPQGEQDTIQPLPQDQERFTVKHNHAISLEDDFSYYQRRAQSWKVVSIDPEKEKIHVEPILQQPGLAPPELSKDGIHTPYTFDIDDRTQVWKDRRLSDLADIQAGATVQLNLTWAQGWAQKEFRVRDLWLDDVSRNFATELQLRRHLRHQRQRWAPGWIDDVEEFDFGGGIVTLTLFEVDEAIIEDFRKEKEDRIAVAVAEKTLRTWFHRSDRKFGKLIEWQEDPSPPLGSSGIQLRLKFTELLAGYRRGACVRVKCDSWKFVTMPPEERVLSREDQQRGTQLSLP